MLYIKALIIWIGIASVEVLHGIARAKLLAPRVGDFRSRQIAVFSGSCLILLMTYFTFPWLNPQSPTEALQVGLVWFLAMFFFEMSLGHFVFKFTWKWLLNDFAFWKGRLLAFGMLILFLAPYLVGKLEGRW